MSGMPSEKRLVGLIYPSSLRLKRNYLWREKLLTLPLTDFQQGRRGWQVLGGI